MLSLQHLLHILHIRKWNLSERRLQTMCNEGVIPGVMKFGHAWAIPENAEKPVDKRIKSGKYIKS